ncbi:MAG: lipid-A-disaccharide synthase [Pseudohongiellaceae bacterium]
MAEQVLRIGIVAGEKSGDNLGAGLMRAMRERYPGCRFEGIGGPAMLAQGLDSLYPMDRLSVMGFIEPLGRLPELLRIKKRLHTHFTANRPAAFIGIDSPGFNLRLERNLHDSGLRTVHYVSPSVWAYGAKRIHKIKAAVDLMLVLFPFEMAIYREHAIDVKFVGHPLADRIGPEDRRKASREKLDLPGDTCVIAILPGSRQGEVTRLGSIFLEAAARALQSHPQLRFVIPCATSDIKDDLLHRVDSLALAAACQLLDGATHTAVSAADLVVLASGTATLETLLLKRPMVVAYRLAPLTYMLASRMLRVPYISLPNLLAGKRLIPEYLQQEATPENIAAEIETFVNGSRNTESLMSQFAQIHETLRCNADQQAADAVLRFCGVQEPGVEGKA